MENKKFFRGILISAVLFFLVACQGQNQQQAADTAKDEEVGVQLQVGDTYDYTRKGVRLVMHYDENSQSFVGTIENTTNEPIQQVRVEVHLSNGAELGPTSPVDLAPGEKQGVTLAAQGQEFSWWKAHPEAGAGEHGSGESHEGGEEHAGEHGEKGGHK